MSNIYNGLAASYGMKIGVTQVGTKYTYYLGKGNNSRLVRRVMAARRHWVELDPEDDDVLDANFIWT
jgi:hypothetical protein